MTIQEKLTNAETIMREVQTMRKLQKEYYKTPYEEKAEKSKLLSQSKIQEKKGDEMIANYFPTQPRLF